jgi:aryl-alcohol dehydrogenase-like predicted oxidoreductase
MQKRKFGKTDMEVSVLGLGGLSIGYDGISIEGLKSLLQGAIDAGLNTIDTAECYGNGEELIGKALGNHRKDVYLFSKCGHGEEWKPCWSKSEIIDSVERSLKRLQTDYLDLIQLHSCEREILEKGEAIEALEECKKSGKARFIGYSGDSYDAEFAIKTDAFDALQTSISIADQQAIDLLLPLAIDREMGVIAKRPIANAVFRFDTIPDHDYYIPYWERLQKLNYHFANGNWDSVADIALRFTTTVPGVHTAIVGTRIPGRWQENATILDKGPLSPGIYHSIRGIWKATADKEWVGLI